MKFTVRLTPDADEQIFDQARYIAEDQKAPIEAGRWLQRIYDAIDSLEEMPRSCSIAEEDAFKEYEVRKRGIDGFILLYYRLRRQTRGLDHRHPCTGDGSQSQAAAK